MTNIMAEVCLKNAENRVSQRNPMKNRPVTVRHASFQLRNDVPHQFLAGFA